MNFQYIAPIESSKSLLDVAFRKARAKGKAKKLTGNWLQIIRQKESLKLDVIKDNLVTKLRKVLDEFPGTEDLSDFYTKLMKLTLDYPQYKKSLGAVNWAVGKISDLHRSYVKRVVKEKDRVEIKNLMKQFYGRVSSITKQVDTNFKYLNKCRNIMRTYPDIKDLFTVCIYGFPNVGKTTLLNHLTTSKAKVAAYAFTTVTINSGFMGKKVQVLDVPGTLARKEKMNNVELQAELVLHDLADLVIYVFDLTERCGYSVKDQEKLFKHLGKKKPILVYLSKTDLMDSVEFKQRYYSINELKEKIKSLFH